MSAHPSTRPHLGLRTERLGGGEADIDRAAALLSAGKLVAFPTETVYGLGADAADAGAVAALYAAKGRPRFNPLIAHAPDLAAAAREGVLDAAAGRLARAFWPGPLTLVVPLAAEATTCDLARAGLGTIALRVPSHPIARALLARVGRPVVAPSANRSGHVSPTAAAHVAADLDGAIDAILDGGLAPLGLESTIVACLRDGVRMLRPGSTTRRAIEQTLGSGLADGADAGRPVAPGALASHYAPRARLRLDAADLRPGEVALLFGPAPAGGTGPRLNLSPSGDLAEAAANLFGHLRRLDDRGAATIAVSPVPETGLGEAINDRLRRAAADR